jgi:hypothetical protein
MKNVKTYEEVSEKEFKILEDYIIHKFDLWYLDDFKDVKVKKIEHKYENQPNIKILVRFFALAAGYVELVEKITKFLGLRNWVAISDYQHFITIDLYIDEKKFRELVEFIKFESDANNYNL